MKKLRVGIIGAGFIATTAHIPALQLVADKVEIVAIADNRPDALAHAADRFGIPNRYTDAHQMLRENQFDLVHVCTANNTHKEFSIAAMQAGANVLCEKPLALTLADAKEMFRVSKETGKKLIACQNLRMGPMQEIKKIIDSGTLGDVYYTEIELLRRRGVPTWGRFHVKDDNGAGCLCDVGVHQIDATLFATGNPKLKSIFAFTNNQLATAGDANEENVGAVTGDKPYLYRTDYNYKDFSVEDFAGAVAIFENGMRMMLKFSWAINVPNSSFYRISGTKGGIFYDRESGLVHPITLCRQVNGYMANEILQIPIAKKGAMPDIGHRMLIRHIVEDVLIGGKPCVIQEEEMLNVVALIDAFYRSAALGRSVDASEL